MRKSRFTTEQIIGFIKQAEAGIAAQRKVQGITQVELAEGLGISQQAMNSFEKGRRRVPVSLLPVIAHKSQTTLDALVAQEAPVATAAPKKRGPQKKYPAAA